MTAQGGLAEEIATIRGLLRADECLAAYDAAVLATPLGDARAMEPVAATELGYLRALALARSGATDRASVEVDTVSAAAPWDDLPASLAEDLAALPARIEKYRAWTAQPADPSALAGAADAYEEVYRRFGRSFAAVNAASLWRLAGDEVRAGDLAREVLSLLDREATIGGEPDYWNLATRAEALLVLGQIDESRDCLALAGVSAGGDLGARASTRRQLRVLCSSMGVDPNRLLAGISQPEVVHYCGHMVAAPGAPGRFPAEEVDRVTAQVVATIKRHHAGYFHGSLASGADIIVAETALEMGAELHVVLPFGAEEFAEVSVAPAGPGWVDRFLSCVAAASSVLVASDSAYAGDDVLFAYAARIAMGHARNRATGLESVVWQLAVFDGDGREQAGGTAHDMAVWAAAGGTTEIIPVHATCAPGAGAPSPSTPPRRQIRSVLFGDVKGFSRLRDEHIDAFLSTIMAPIGAVLDSYGDDVLVRNTWGDGLFVVMADTVAGARCALDIQDCFAAMDLEAAGLPPDMGMRLGGHTAPVISVHDPVLHVSSVMGRELTRAARIEPRTPTGQVYVTAAFAALLSLQPDAGVMPEYVGHLTTAKDFETTAMYLLRR